MSGNTLQVGDRAPKMPELTSNDVAPVVSVGEFELGRMRMGRGN
jgi:hypothetical protein